MVGLPWAPRHYPSWKMSGMFQSQSKPICASKYLCALGSPQQLKQERSAQMTPALACVVQQGLAVDQLPKHHWGHADLQFKGNYSSANEWNCNCFMGRYSKMPPTQLELFLRGGFTEAGIMSRLVLWSWLSYFKASVSPFVKFRNTSWLFSYFGGKKPQKSKIPLPSWAWTASLWIIV